MALEARLDLEPADAVRFFAAKGEALSWDYTDTWREANVHAFTVAKATSLEVLRTI
ncbi:MAG: phage head morphogenesis protein, partial [Burkholderiaceae bacterium]|nr:phage head morphogenesis protein [Burkholderiaceae bacterium]